jgi:hypothetical protein
MVNANKLDNAAQTEDNVLIVSEVHNILQDDQHVDDLRRLKKQAVVVGRFANVCVWDSAVLVGLFRAVRTGRREHDHELVRKLIRNPGVENRKRDVDRDELDKSHEFTPIVFVFDTLVDQNHHYYA